MWVQISWLNELIWIYTFYLGLALYQLRGFNNFRQEVFVSKEQFKIRSSVILLFFEKIDNFPCGFKTIILSKVKLTDTYMPYLTLWDKISQNLALLKADSYKIFKSHRILRTSKNTFYKEIIINHTLLCLSHISYIKINPFLVIFGEFQSDFCENLTVFYQIFLKILVYLTDFSPQFMACMLI